MESRSKCEFLENPLQLFNELKGAKNYKMQRVRMPI